MNLKKLMGRSRISDSYDIIAKGHDDFEEKINYYPHKILYKVIYGDSCLRDKYWTFATEDEALEFARDLAKKNEESIEIEKHTLAKCLDDWYIEMFPSTAYKYFITDYKHEVIYGNYHYYQLGASRGWFEYNQNRYIYNELRNYEDSMIPMELITNIK